MTGPIWRGIRRVFGHHEPLDMSPAAQLTRLAHRLDSEPVELPRLTNGPAKTTRPTNGPCPLCRQPEDRWCWDGCAALDPMDYR